LPRACSLQRSRKLAGSGSACRALTYKTVSDPGALYSTIAAEHREALAAAEQVAIRDRTPFDQEVSFLRADGNVCWGRIVSAPRQIPDGSLVWDGLLVDITERRRAVDALQEEAHSLEVLNRTGALLAAELDLERVLQAVTDAATELSGAAFGALFYNTVSESNETLALYTLSGAPRSAFERLPMSRGTDVFGPMLAGEGIVRSDDILADLRYGRTRRTAACQPSSSAPAFEVIAPPSKPPTHDGPRQVQNRTTPGYTPSASGISPASP
jgi:PAS domain-containing protein